MIAGHPVIGSVILGGPWFSTSDSVPGRRLLPNTEGALVQGVYRPGRVGEHRVREHPCWVSGRTFDAVPNLLRVTDGRRRAAGHEAAGDAMASGAMQSSAPALCAPAPRHLPGDARLLPRRTRCHVRAAGCSSTPSTTRPRRVRENLGRAASSVVAAARGPSKTRLEQRFDVRSDDRPPTGALRRRSGDPGRERQCRRRPTVQFVAAANFQPASDRRRFSDAALVLRPAGRSRSHTTSRRGRRRRRVVVVSVGCRRPLRLQCLLRRPGTIGQRRQGDGAAQDRVGHAADADSVLPRGSVVVVRRLARRVEAAADDDDDAVLARLPHGAAALLRDVREPRQGLRRLDPDLSAAARPAPSPVPPAHLLLRDRRPA